jgi:uncharacterized protein
MKRFVLSLLLIACTSSGQAPKPAAAPLPPRPAKVTDVTAEDYDAPRLPKARVTLNDAFGFKHAVDAEVAATRDARTRGLMWRSSLPEGTGMLFIFPAEEELNFWMKNTLIPLDMVFISKDRVIVGIVERAEPRTLSARGPGRPATFVLEVPGGWAAKIGLKPGLKVQVDGVSAIVPTD